MEQIVANYWKIKKGFIAQCPQNPQFLVQTTTKSKIKIEMKEMIQDYVKIFPDEKDDILPKTNFEIILKAK